VIFLYLTGRRGERVVAPQEGAKKELKDMVIRLLLKGVEKEL
jgi:hypothetical protein